MSRKILSTTKLVKPTLNHNFATKTKHDSTELFVAISQLPKYGIELKSLPEVIVVGPQSSGKSSVIEALCGETILPKAMEMATMKPTSLTLIRSQEKRFKVGDREFRTDMEAAEEIYRANKNHHVQKVHVTIWSPDVYNTNLIDLPGLFVVADKNNMDLPKKIKDMTLEYLQQMSNIPLVVHAGPQDPATNQAIKLIRKFNRDDDTMGIITKVDMLEKQKTKFIDDMLNGNTCELGYGYCTVILRNDTEIEAGMTINDKIKSEKEIFSKLNLHPSGVPQMRKMVSDIQFEKFKEKIPEILVDIDANIANLKVSQNFLQNLVNNDQSQLASRLRKMIEKLVGSSLDRAEFESDLRKRFKKRIGEYISLTPLTKGNVLFSNQNIDSKIFDYNHQKKSSPNNYKKDKIKKRFSYGLVSPIALDNRIIADNFSDELELSIALPMIDLYIDDPQGKKRLNWNKDLSKYFSKLLTDDNIHKIIYEVTHEALLEYLYNDVEQVDELTKKFAEYMVTEIGNEAYESKIKYSITAMLNIEKRPQVSMFEMTRYFAQMHPEYFTFTGNFMESFTKNRSKLKIEVYGKEWNNAYLRVVSDKLIENCYRNVAVNLLDRMVEKLLEMTIDIFNKDHALKEQNKVREKTDKLTEIRNIVASHDTKNKCNYE